MRDLPHVEPPWYAHSVRRGTNGRIEWAAVTAVAALVAALAAVATSALLFWHVRQDTQRILFSSGIDSLWRLEEEWSDLAEVRSAAATSLLNGQPSRDVEAILDFFDEVALLAQRGALDEEMVWYRFYVPMSTYWFASQDAVRKARAATPTMWQKLDGVMPRLMSIEAQRRGRGPDVVVPTAAQIHDFLTAEIDSNQCTDERDEEARKTPL